MQAYLEYFHKQIIKGMKIINHKSTCEKYAQNYINARNFYETAYYSNDFKKFIENALLSINSFCSFFICYSLPGNEKLANLILEGKANLKGDLIENTSGRPVGKLLIKYIYQSPYSDLLSEIRSQFFYSLHEELLILKSSESLEENSVSNVRNKLLCISSVFDEIYEDSDGIEQRLKQALSNCKKVSNEGYKKAKTQLEQIREANKSITQILEENCAKISAQKLVDSNFQNKLIEQLLNVQNFFVEQTEIASNDIDNKHRITDNYNITLFGRTNVGKSTLMEILTEGKGNAIGHGGQRTTRDVRTYQWKGLTVTDVPGFDAQGGAIDEVLAEQAARYADEIAFMITASHPESLEADWLVKLKRMDKPMICICNVKRTVDDERHLNNFLENPEAILDKQGVQEAVEQFQKFVNEKLPNENIKIIVSHLRGRFLANQKEYEGVRNQLITASRFANIEKAIIKDVVTNGILFRKKCYLSIIDVPVYNQMVSLLQYSADNYHSYILIKEKEDHFNSWNKTFCSKEIDLLSSKIESVYDNIETSVGSFVDDSAEEKDFDDRLQSFLNSKNVERKVNSFYRISFNKAKTNIENIFKDMDAELKLSSANQTSLHVSGKHIADVGKGLGWTSGGFGVIASVLLWFPVTQPLGIVCGILSLGTGLTGTLWKSREKRLRKFKNEVTEQIISHLENEKFNTISSVKKSFKKEIQYGLISEAQKRFSLIEGTLLLIVNSLRSIALTYAKNHTEISQKMVQNIVNELGLGKIQIDCVARIPGKISVIISPSTKLKDSSVRTKISQGLGNSESVLVFSLDRSLPLQRQFNQLSKLLNLPHLNPKIKSVVHQQEEQIIAYCQPVDGISYETDGILLIEQILKLQVIFFN